MLTAAEAEQVLQQPDIAQASGLRDRAILETLYSTGMRRMELVNLKSRILDLERATVIIRQGKGHKDRIIPIGERALAWIASTSRRRARNCSPARRRHAVPETGRAVRAQLTHRMVRGYVSAPKSARWAAAICSATPWRH